MQPNQQSQSQIPFSDSSKAPIWLGILGILCGLAAICLLVLALFVAPSQFENSVAAVVGASIGFVILVFGAILGLTSGIRVRVSESDVLLSFAPIWRTRIARGDISDAHEADVNAVEFGGLGLRAVPGRRALLFSSGPGVSLRRSSTGTEYLIRTNNASGLLNAIRND